MPPAVSESRLGARTANLGILDYIGFVNRVSAVFFFFLVSTFSKLLGDMRIDYSGGNPVSI